MSPPPPTLQRIDGTVCSSAREKEDGERNLGACQPTAAGPALTAHPSSGLLAQPEVRHQGWSWYRKYKSKIFTLWQSLHMTTIYLEVYVGNTLCISD